ncbi:uncharacterized protein LOC109790925 [Cajanus cajan]|uniref:uncharacterized protein LOC109790925 n=1 Tax=Cajanus cajan TaxID=3821 RepID=UPI00098DA6CB|nr:uncharacterized protein LOC109790925 [Cajanus cajan]
MAGRNDRAIADALQALAQAINNNNRVEVAPNWLEQFQQNHPPTFKGGYDPDAAMNWLTEIEKIFNVMDCPLTQKVKLATFMLTADAHFWWEGALRRMIDGGVHLNWDNFKKWLFSGILPIELKDEGGVGTIEVPPNVGPTIKANAVSQMEAAMAALSAELSKLQTGRASPGMLDHIIVETSGLKMPFAVVSVLDPKTLSVNPYDPEAMDAIKKLYSSLPKDDIKRLEKEVDDLTKKFIKTAEDVCKAKEKEISQG